MRNLLTVLNARSVDGALLDIVISDGVVESVVPAGGASPDLGEAIDLGGRLLAPSFVDGHVHLDKTMYGAARVPHVAVSSLRERIALERRNRRPDDEVARSAEALVEAMVRQGTTAVRSHVDVDPGIGMRNLATIVALRERVRHALDIQIVAFPQSGIVSEPGVADLLDAALTEGADLVGGLDPAGFDVDVDGQLDVVFRLAERRGVGIDIHLHDPGRIGREELKNIAGRTAAAGLAGRVTVSHAYALAGDDPEDVRRTAEALATADVKILTSGAPQTPPLPLRLLEAAGVGVMLGSDNIRDVWWPYGNGDMLERAALVGMQQQFCSDEELRLLFELATTRTAAAIGIRDHALERGAAADTVAFDAASVPEVVLGGSRRMLVVKAGRVIVRDGGLTTADSS